MEQIKDTAEFQDMILSEKPTVAVFKADWCKDCKFIDPFMPEVEAAYSDRLRFVVVDRDAFPELGEQYNVLGIPSFIGFYKGNETIRFVSKLRKSREEIEQFLDRVVQVSGELAAKQ